MTNYEKFKETLIDMLKCGDMLAVTKHGEPAVCGVLDCMHCSFASSQYGFCEEDRVKWLNAEYIEKPKLTQREWHLCKAIETGWIARNESGLLYRFEEKPSKSGEIWFHLGIMLSLRIVPDCFEFIQWQDEEPWSVEHLLKLEVEE